MKSLITPARLAALAGPAQAWDAGPAPAQEAAQRFAADCAIGGASPAVCACVLARLVAVADDALALDLALAGGLAGVAGSSDPRLAEAFVTGSRDCGGTIALRGAGER
jgi:hypothetical protein